MTDPVLAQVGEAMAASRTDVARARTMLNALWDTASDPLHRCAIASALAGIQDSESDELVWDLRALEAGRLLDDARLLAAGMGASSFELLASLHANLADVYRRLAHPHVHGPGCSH